MKNDDRGFSLVELLIAIAISSIVLSAVIFLIAQAVKSYGKQTALAQIQSDADITLNQISKNIMEATEIYLVEDSQGLKFYTTKDSSKTRIGYYYDKNDKTLYYSDEGSVNKLEKNKMSVVCDYVTSFSVKLDTSNFKLKDDTTIEKLPENYKYIVNIGLERVGEKRNVERTYTTRNKIKDDNNQINNIKIFMWKVSEGCAKELKLTDKLSNYSSNTYVLK